MGSVFLDQLDADVIGLGERCTNPLFTTGPKKDDGKKITLALEDDEEIPAQTGVMRGTDRATVSLSDCLACSGCVTSAETVLLSTDAVGKFNELEGAVVVAMSHASLASIAATMNASPSATLAAIRRLLSPATVVTTSRAWDLVLVEAAAEFLSRLTNEAAPTPPEPRIAVSRDVVKDAAGNDTNLGPPTPSPGPLPMLCGECPGVVCFLEKNAPHAVPHLSSTRSILAATAALEKRVPSSKVSFVGIAPCADKKLEAARRDFSVDNGDDEPNFDMDLILTTKEAMTLLGGPETLRKSLEEEDDDLDDLIAATTPPMPMNASSGGYLEYIYRTVAASRGIPVPPVLEYTRVRNDDCHAVTLELDGRTLTFARAYGFRNVQKIANSIKQNKCPYDFVEIMACPSGGCANGGGQLQGDDGTRDAVKLRAKQVDDTVHYHATTTRDPSSSPDVGPDDDRQPRALPDLVPWIHTRHHYIPQLQDTLNPGLAKW